jgi:DNA transformation protein and related proteins
LKQIVDQYVEYLQEVFEQFGPITARRMFGGYGIYHRGVMFALVADETLYLKADADNMSHFEEAGLGPFEFSKQGKVVKLSYYAAPDEIFDDSNEAATWALRSYEAALRSQKKGARRG